MKQEKKEKKTVLRLRKVIFNIKDKEKKKEKKA